MQRSSLKYYYYRKPIGDPLETDMPDQRPIGDQHASSETHMLDQVPIGYQHALAETHWRPACLIIDPQEIHILPRVGLRSGISVSDEACRSPMGLRSGMSVSDGSLIGLR